MNFVEPHAITEVSELQSLVNVTTRPDWPPWKEGSATLDKAEISNLHGNDGGRYNAHLVSQHFSLAPKIDYIVQAAHLLSILAALVIAGTEGYKKFQLKMKREDVGREPSVNETISHLAQVLPITETLYSQHLKRHLYQRLVEIMEGKLGIKRTDKFYR